MKTNVDGSSWMWAAPKTLVLTTTIDVLRTYLLLTQGRTYYTNVNTDRSPNRARMLLTSMFCLLT